MTKLQISQKETTIGIANKVQSQSSIHSPSLYYTNKYVHLKQLYLYFIIFIKKSSFHKTYKTPKLSSPFMTIN